MGTWCGSAQDKRFSPCHPVCPAVLQTPVTGVLSVHPVPPPPESRGSSVQPPFPHLRSSGPLCPVPPTPRPVTGVLSVQSLPRSHGDPQFSPPLPLPPPPSVAGVLSVQTRTLLVGPVGPLPPPGSPWRRGEVGSLTGPTGTDSRSGKDGLLSTAAAPRENPARAAHAETTYPPAHRQRADSSPPAPDDAPSCAGRAPHVGGHAHAHVGAHALSGAGPRPEGPQRGTL